MKRTFSLWLLVAVISTGCAALQRRHTAEMNSYLGQPSALLVNQWGPPSESTPIGDGQFLLVWRTARKGELDLQIRQVTVNANGIIVAWRWQGL